MTEIPPTASTPPSATPDYATPPGTVPLGVPDKDARTMAMLAHLLGIPMGFVGPLIIYLVKKDSSPFVEDQAKEALNFHITITLALIVSGILFIVIIGIVLFPVVAIAGLVLSIMACMKANEGIAYRYPFAIRFIK